VSHLRFTAAAETQLQQAHQHLNGSARQHAYDQLVSTLIHLERDAALFTMLEATALSDALAHVYAAVIEADPPARPVVLAYGLDNNSEDVVIFDISW